MNPSYFICSIWKLKLSRHQSKLTQYLRNSFFHWALMDWPVSPRRARSLSLGWTANRVWCLYYTVSFSIWNLSNVFVCTFSIFFWFYNLIFSVSKRNFHENATLTIRLVKVLWTDNSDRVGMVELLRQTSAEYSDRRKMQRNSCDKFKV